MFLYLGLWNRSLTAVDVFIAVNKFVSSLCWSRCETDRMYDRHLSRVWQLWRRLSCVRKQWSRCEQSQQFTRRLISSLTLSH